MHSGLGSLKKGGRAEGRNGPAWAPGPQGSGPRPHGNWARGGPLLFIDLGPQRQLCSSYFSFFVLREAKMKSVLSSSPFINLKQGLAFINNRVIPASGSFNSLQSCKGFYFTWKSAPHKFMMLLFSSVWNFPSNGAPSLERESPQGIVRGFDECAHSECNLVL